MKTITCKPQEIFDYQDRLQSMGYEIKKVKKVDMKVILYIRTLFPHIWIQDEETKDQQS